MRKSIYCGREIRAVALAPLTTVLAASCGLIIAQRVPNIGECAEQRRRDGNAEAALPHCRQHDRGKSTVTHGPYDKPESSVKYGNRNPA